MCPDSGTPGRITTAFKTATAMQDGCGFERFIIVGGDTSSGDRAASIAICKIFLDKGEAKGGLEGRGSE